MVFEQTEVLAGRVLDDRNHIHRVRLVGGQNEGVVAALAIRHGQ